MTRDNEIANAASEAMTETLMSCPMYEFNPKATDLLECAYIKGAEWADKHPANLWHSVKDGDLPPFNKVCLFNCNGTTYIGFVRGDKSLYLENYLYLSLSINDINYWMKIPELPTE